MNVIFSPEYSGTVFVAPSEGTKVLMDSIVVNTIGLINLLELRLGLHYEEIPEHKRLAFYYNAVCKYMAQHPDNILKASFQTSGLGTAQAMLAWRDELRSFEWNTEDKKIRGRIGVLLGVEEYFKECKDYDPTTRMHTIIEQMNLQNFDCQDLHILVPVSKDLLKPIVRKLIESLEAHGASIEIMPQAMDNASNLSKVRNMLESEREDKLTLDENDESLLIYEFNDEQKACEWLAYNDMDDVNVWINSDNKQMDDWMTAMNKAHCGSIAKNCTPRLTQLLTLGLRLSEDPLNVNTLIEWLNMPQHPLDKYFRSRMADTIIREGGYRNEACRALIKEYIDGSLVYLNDEQKSLPEKDQEKLRRKDLTKRQKNVRAFLPPLERKKELLSEDVKNFVLELASWARQRAHLMTDRGWEEQLMTVANMCESFDILLSGWNEKVIDYKTVNSWMSIIYQRGSYSNAIAEIGCRTVVDSPAKLASISEKTIWVGVDGDYANAEGCDFLYPSEKDQLTREHAICPWDESLANKYHQRMMLTPIRMTSGQLILIVRKRIGGEQTLKHPLIVRLEQQITNFEKFVRRPKLGIGQKRERKPIENTGLCAELQFNNADKIHWPDHLSPTTIDTLIEYPFDFLMDQILGISAEGVAKMSDIRQTKGNLAHAVIEALFSTRENETISSPDNIEKRISSDYEKTYSGLLEKSATILQLPENKLEERLLHEQLLGCVNTLVKILKDNDLVVSECEKYIECHMGLGLPISAKADKQSRDMTARLDMTLKDKFGHPVVFDFKWTSWPKGYQDKLLHNRATQLELYRWLLSDESKSNVERVAYFVMPQGHLYSKERFEGPYCTQVLPENVEDIVEQVRRSALYRKAQIDSGIVETTGLLKDLKYAQDTATSGLFPLEEEKSTGMKKNNPFTQYKQLNR